MTPPAHRLVSSLLLVASPETGAVYSPSTPGAIAYDRTINDELRQKAAYAELSYKLADQLTLTKLDWRRRAEQRRQPSSAGGRTARSRRRALQQTRSGQH